MKRVIRRDVPPRAAIVVCALALLASVVTGREEEDAPPPLSKAEAQSDTKAGAPAGEAANIPSAADLEIDRLARPRKEDPVPDLFASRAWIPKPVAALPPRPARSEPAAPPAPPPVPFRYIGKMIDGEKVVVFLEKAGDIYSVGQGDNVDGQYRVDEISDSAVSFIYVPLGAAQALPIAPSR